MEILTLEMIKANSRIETRDEDALLVMFGETAEDVVSRHIRRSWQEVQYTYGFVPAPLRTACLMLADHFYTNRGATTPVQATVLPIGVQAIVKPYVKLK